MGDRDAMWAALYERHFDDVYRLIRRGGVSDSDADDVAQRVFLRVHDLLASGLSEVVNPLGWLRAITIRVVSEHHRFWRLRRVKQWVVELTASLVPRVATPEQSLAATREQARVAQILTLMTPKLRDVLVLSDLEDLALNEVAMILDVPKNTVRSRRKLARDQFARLWSKRHGGRP
ncbi:MAG TPA: sigma-70 family RNA polymerase sigma factor [Kofleriaceae bacterium]